MKLTENKTQAIVAVSGKLTAAEVETLISDLAELRAHMEPPVPFDEPIPENFKENQKISVQNNPYISLRLLRNRGIRLWLRHHGIGWMIFNIPTDKACAIRDYLIANTPEENPNARFLGDQIGDKGRFH